MNLLELTPKGLYCPQARLYIDPWSPVDKAIITHAHSDHCRWGMKHYLVHSDAKEVVKLRLGADISVETLPYEQPLVVNGVSVSMHAAGHIPGSAQERLEYKGRVDVVSGDYKTEYDGLSAPFEPLACHGFVSECTFGLPIYQWEPQARVFESINRWWHENASLGRCSLLFAYSLGKAQRVLTQVNKDIGPIYVHGAVWNTNQALLANHVALPEIEKVTDSIPKSNYRNALIIAPPAAFGTPWTRRFAPFRTAVCSGWMNVRGTRRRRSADAGFVLSDHADWGGLNAAIAATGAEEVFLTHGYTDVFARHLWDQGLDAKVLETLFVGEVRDGED